MAKASSKTKVNKSEWIRQQPATLTAKELVSKAKKEGIEITDAQVYTTRSAAKKATTDGAVKAKGKPGPKPKTVAASSNEKINKSAWIRQQPATLTAKEVVEKAAKEGIEISPTQVYTARSTADVAKSAPAKSSAAAPKKAVRNTAGLLEYAKIVARVGTDQSREWLDHIEKHGLVAV